MNELILTDEQLRVVYDALEFYSRVGIGQFNVICDHPTFDKHLAKNCVPNKEPEVGDRTPQGEILEIKGGKALINGSVGEDGFWSKEQEWKDLGDVKLSRDWGKFHGIQDIAKVHFLEAKKQLSSNEMTSLHGSWGIYNKNVDESCRIAFDIVQVIRHEWWKASPDRSNITVDSSVHLGTEDSNKIKCNINK